MAGVAGAWVDGAGSGVMASNGALRSPLNGGKALSNSASGTIGASERGSFDCGWSLGLGASGPLAGAVPGFTNCAEPMPANPVVDATNARASQ